MGYKVRHQSHTGNSNSLVISVIQRTGWIFSTGITNQTTMAQEQKSLRKAARSKRILFSLFLSQLVFNRSFYTEKLHSSGTIQKDVTIQTNVMYNVLTL